MRQFYLIVQKGATLSHQISWSHYSELLPLKNIKNISYYVMLIEQQKISIRELRNRIKSKEHERLNDSTKKKLITNDKLEISDEIKHPVIIKNRYDTNNISEKMLKTLILENIDGFLTELGNGFCYIKNEYKIKTDTGYNHIDLLLSNTKYNCYVVIELKVTELKKEHIG